MAFPVVIDCLRAPQRGWGTCPRSPLSEQLGHRLVAVARAYFDDGMGLRQLLFWALTTRRQLERWEPLVAENLRSQIAHEPVPGALIWQAEAEHHFVLIAARNLLRALELGHMEVALDATIKAELIEGRDLNEHGTRTCAHQGTESPPGESLRCA